VSAPARGDKEAVFSSSEDRIRYGVTAAAIVGLWVVRREAGAGLRARWTRRAGESFFSVPFPSDGRICGLPLLNISPLPACPAGLEAVEPTDRDLCSICGETVSSSCVLSDDDGPDRCPLCRRRDRPLERAVARTRDSDSQLGLPSPQRRNNSRAAFSRPRAQEVTGREVLPVDDVYTSGAAASECARVLPRDGASTVGVRTLARTLESASKYEETDTVATIPEADFKVSKRMRNRLMLRTWKL
jgi:predicted amidophosphoribosyltransferase